MTKTNYEKELERQIEKRKNWKGCGSELQRGGLCSKNHFCTGCMAYKEGVYDLEVTLRVYKKGKQDKEEEIMNNGNFITSMNRKVCYNAGYEKGKQEERERMKKLKEGVDEVFEFYDIKLLLTNIKYKEGNKIKESDELMKLFDIFWEYLKPQLKSDLKNKFKEYEIEEKKNE